MKKTQTFQLSKTDVSSVVDLLAECELLSDKERMFLETVVTTFERDGGMNRKQIAYFRALVKKASGRKYKPASPTHKRNTDKPKKGMIGPPPGTIFYSGDAPPWKH